MNIQLLGRGVNPQQLPSFYPCLSAMTNWLILLEAPGETGRHPVKPDVCAVSGNGPDKFYIPQYAVYQTTTA
jgi:hypothetical protein